MPKSCQYSTRIQYKPRALGKCVNRAFGPVASRTRASRCCIVVKPRVIGELFVHLKVRGQKLHSIFATQSTIARIPCSLAFLLLFSLQPLATSSKDMNIKLKHKDRRQRCGGDTNTGPGPIGRAGDYTSKRWDQVQHFLTMRDRGQLIRKRAMSGVEMRRTRRAW